MSDAIDTLKKTGMPERFLATFSALQEARERIRAQRYQAPREVEEFVRLEQSTAKEIVVQKAKVVAGYDQVRDAKLRAVDAEELERMRLPTKREFETENEFTNRLSVTTDKFKVTVPEAL